FLTIVGASVAAVAVIWILLRRAPELRFDQMATVIVFALLFLLTARTAFRAAYVNADNATEFLVYAHSATGVKTVLEQVEELSRRTTDGMAIDLGYDDDVSWPFTWYLRNFTKVHYFGQSPGRDVLDYPVIIVGDNNWAKVEPILGDRYFSFEYIRMWWPMQDYWDLTWERIRSALVSPEYRRALWNIWFDRDFTAYGALKGVDFSLENWSPSDRMRLYVRKDVEALIWEYGVAPTLLEVPAVADPYEEGTVALASDRILGGAGAGPGQFQNPRDLAFAPDGTLYVADTFNHRIQHLAADGSVLHTWGRFANIELSMAPGGTFNEPWGIAVAADGRVYVADTWNHRVQWFTPEGRFLGMVGTFGQAETVEAMWGPRDVAIDAQGRFFVADTGNKRIVVFDRDGSAVGAFGGRGVLPGLLDEPVGLALDPDGRLLVADTWNQRIQAFDGSVDAGFPVLSEWSLEAWYGQSLENKPYLAISPEGTVCASDPEGYRILCFTLDGTFVTAFGSYGQAGDQFGLPSGLAFAPDGALWVVDSGNSRVMRFVLEVEAEGISWNGRPAPAVPGMEGV
ncbi:MAG: NHL repeat-containing protein, partial [Anaerolineales bacterium]